MAASTSPTSTLSDADLNPRLELAKAVAREAGQLTLRYFRQEELEIDLKGDSTPVTAADRAAEELIRERVSAVFPDDRILGEEFPEKPGTSGFCWVLDPIDGTKSFIRGTPQWGNLVGVTAKDAGDESVIGAVYIPVLDELYYAAAGQGAYEVRCGGQPRRIAVSTTSRLSEALFTTTSVNHFENYGRLAAFEELRKASGMDRTWGDCYGYMLVATGRADIMIDPKMSIWDCSAPQAIVVEAGGTFTDWQGHPTMRSGEGVATNKALLESVISILGQHPRRR